ncbi:MAG TPA: hypothetical protein VFB58_17635 [Chloroflexota bacterium]|nr:hypothetical protein [Chloroflexota bacterium]
MTIREDGIVIRSRHMEMDAIGEELPTYSGLRGLDRKLIDYEPGRPLTVVAMVESIRHFFPNCREVGYCETPFFAELNRLQGTPHVTTSENPFVYEGHRNALFNAQDLDTIDLDTLIFTQPVVNKAAVDHLEAHPDSFPVHPFAVRYQSEVYLMDGHHRTVAAKAEGNAVLDMHIIDFDAPARIRPPLPFIEDEGAAAS